MTRFGLRPPCPFNFEDLAVPAVSILIIFLAYTSQYLFYYIEPGPLTQTEAVWFNIFVLGIWWCYDRACSVDPGPKGWVDKSVRAVDDSEDEAIDAANIAFTGTLRWCKKCDAAKPPRAHHCKKCGRYFSTSSHLPIHTLLMIPGADASPKWTTTAHGLRTASHILPFPTSFALSCTP
jgi:palmitoyltransferase